MEGALGHYKIDVSNAGDHFSDLDASGREDGLRDFPADTTQLIYGLHDVTGDEDLHVTRHTTQ
jgi:hypothetical protein